MRRCYDARVVSGVKRGLCLLATMCLVIACSSAEQRPQDQPASNSAGTGGSTAAAAGGSAVSVVGRDAGTKSDVGAGAAGSAGRNTAGITSDGGGSGIPAGGRGGANAQNSDAGASDDAGTPGGSVFQNPASCPASYAQLSTASSCASSAVGCAYPEGYCTCISRCSGVAPDPNEPVPPSHWSCTRPAEGCPMGIPNQGAACSKEGQTCTYGSCCVQLVRCRNASWTVGPMMCPP